MTWFQSYAGMCRTVQSVILRPKQLMRSELTTEICVFETIDLRLFPLGFLERLGYVRKKTIVICKHKTATLRVMYKNWQQLYLRVIKNFVEKGIVRVYQQNRLRHFSGTDINRLQDINTLILSAKFNSGQYNLQKH